MTQPQFDPTPDPIPNDPTPASIDQTGADDSAAPSREATIGIVTADRLCVRCGYNLIGQPIVRESRYGLLVTRCSECGAYSSLVEYPALSRSVTRWTMILASVATLFAVFLTIATSTALVAMTEIGTETLLNPFEFAAQVQYQEFLTAKGSSAGSAWQSGVNEANEWLASVGGTAAFVRNQDAWAKLKGVRLLGTMLPLWTIMFVAGVVWSAFTFGMRRSRTLLALIPSLLLAFVFLAMYHLAAVESIQTNWYDVVVRSIGRHLGAPLRTGISLTLVVALVCGLLVGRPIVRTFVAVILPPRLRGGLAFLWESDGLRTPMSDGRAKRNT